MRFGTFGLLFAAGITSLAAADTPDPKAILAQAEAALQTVDTVRYQAQGSADGPSRLPPIEATVLLAAIPGAEVPKLHVDARTGGPGQEPGRLEVACDGKRATLLDHGRKLFVQRDLPTGQSLLVNVVAVLVNEFTVDAPLARESAAEKLEYGGVERVGDAECDVIYADLGTVATRWYFARTDHLPRRVQRIIKTAQGNTTLTISLAKLEPNARIDGEKFVLERPADYQDASEPEMPRSGRQFLPTGSAAPDFKLRNGDGQEVTLKSLQGKYVILDFWATWCGPCRMAMPGLQRLHTRYKDKPVAVLGVSCWERSPMANPVKFLRDQGYTYPVLLDGRDAAAAYRVSGIPTCYLIGPDGKVLFAYSGPSPENEKTVERLIDEGLAANAPPP